MGVWPMVDSLQAGRLGWTMDVYVLVMVSGEEKLLLIGGPGCERHMVLSLLFVERLLRLIPKLSPPLM